MFIPTELLVCERIEEHEREAERLHLIRLVKGGATDQLNRHGWPLFQPKKRDQRSEPSKN